MSTHAVDSMYRNIKNKQKYIHISSQKNHAQSHKGDFQQNVRLRGGLLLLLLLLVLNSC